jgi:hypothetical protein
MNAEAVAPDTSYYTVLRYPEDGDVIIGRFCASLRSLHARLIDDLRHGAIGRFAESGVSFGEPIATAVERTRGHVDVFETLLLGGVGVAPAPQVVKNVVANVVSDGNFAEIAETHISSPKAKEGKFDTEKAGELLGLGKEYSEKFAQAMEPIAELENYVKLLKLLGFLLKDIGIVGSSAAEPAHNLVGEQVENKLQALLDGMDALIDGQVSITDAIAQATTSITDEIDLKASTIFSLVDRVEGLAQTIKDEVDLIEAKADRLGRLLGRTLVADPWDVAPGSGRRNRVPSRSVKDELHDLEDLLNALIRQLGPITKDPVPDGPPPELTPEDHKTVDQPQIPKLPVARDERLKKIFVYAEGRFAPENDQDFRTIRVRTNAFDLTGWVDLTRLRHGDVIESEIRVSFANRRNILLARTQLPSGRLLTFADLTNGRNYLSGSKIDIVVRQIASADAFATPVELAYQFIVESQ